MATDQTKHQNQDVLSNAGPLLPFEQALDLVLSHARTQTPKACPIDEAHDLVLAKPISAKHNQPPADVSAMDGYAVRAQDTQKQPYALKLMGESAAGHPFTSPIGPRECVRIFTGASLPPGADAILIQENADRILKSAHQPMVSASQVLSPGTFVRPKGLDFQQGFELAAGTLLNGRMLALAGAMNHGSLPVYPRPRVAILSSGDEIQPPGSQLAPGQIASSNHLGLASLVRYAGGIPTFLGIASDHLPTLKDKLREAQDFDLVLTSGGASVGDHDLLARALVTLGAKLDFWKIAMKPGKPMVFGRLDSCPVLGLPGNPVSSYITALLFACPMIALMRGLKQWRLATQRAQLSEPLQANGDRREFRRVTLWQTSQGTWQCKSLSSQDSSMLRGLAFSQGLVSVAPFAEQQAAGAWVEVLLLP